MKVERNDKCPCGSGEKFKNCCINERKVVKHKSLEGIYDNYFIVFDSNKEREVNPSLHLYSPILADVSKALWYCLHMPRNGMDVIFSPDKFFVEGDVLHQHNIFIISSELNEANIDLLNTFHPTLYISEDSCYEESKKLNELCPAKLGSVSIQNLSSNLLSEQWESIKEKVKTTFNDNNIEMESIKILDVSPRLLADEERSTLPNIFLANQNGDTKEVLEFLNRDNYSLKGRMYATKKQLTLFKIWDQLGSELEKISDYEITRALNKAYIYTPCPLIITLPGGPRSRKSYRVDSHEHIINEEEKDLINFFGVQRAISQQGIWLEGNQLNPDIFNKLDNLERHFFATKRKREFILRTMKDFGNHLAECLGIENLGEYALASPRIIAFTDFPIGLAIPPGYSDPLCSMTAISYRPITPLTNTFKYGLNHINDHYIGFGRGFKILILECLSENDHIRKYSDLGWSIMREQLSENKLVTIYYEVVNSKKELEDKIITYQNIDFLIISAHGTYNHEGVSGLVVGGEFWFPEPTLKVPPVVILSACHVATKGRGNYTINDALLNAGAIAVLGTLIPVNVIENAGLTQRLFLYISETLQGLHDCLDLAEAWKRVINMNISFSILNSTKKLANWSLTKNVENLTPYEKYFEMMRKEGEKPGGIHLQTVDILKEIADEFEMKEYLEIVLERSGYISESIFYIFSGYPEKILIQPKLWMVK
ncbi:SEC-C metal-binding domain-containing protein [Gottfriedia sp. S16(2024)]|uniref:YecA family protein n=1 Tax=Gottfriedia sp. S16(2024) TaxID=3162883 RepID=UPI003D20B08A